MILKPWQTLISILLVTLSEITLANIELVVQYPYGGTFKETFATIQKEFEAKNPGIKLKFRAPYENYEEGTKKVLREAITKRLPDVSFHSLNRIRPLVDRNIAVPLDSFIKNDSEFSEGEYDKKILNLGSQHGQVYGMPFAVSLPIVYYNMDLVRKAGWDPDKLPTTWDEVILLAQKINQLNDDITGIVYGWQITGNWLWQASVFSKGGSMLSEDEKKVAFDGKEGEWALKTFARLVKEADMRDYSKDDGRQAFYAGQAGIWIWSTSYVTKAEEMIGNRFEMKTHLFPSVNAGGSLPVGGNAAVMLSKDTKVQSAAWKFIKFVSSARGATIVATTTGYIPPNKNAHSEDLTNFYSRNPNNLTAVNQLHLLTEWYAFPGKNGLKITRVIHDHMQSIASGERVNEPSAVLKAMATDVQKLLPRK